MRVGRLGHVPRSGDVPTVEVAQVRGPRGNPLVSGALGGAPRGSADATLRFRLLAEPTQGAVRVCRLVRDQQGSNAYLYAPREAAAGLAPRWRLDATLGYALPNRRPGYAPLYVLASVDDEGRFMDSMLITAPLV